MSQRNRKTSRDLSGYLETLSPEERQHMKDNSPLKGLTPFTPENIQASAFHISSPIDEAERRTDAPTKLRGRTIGELEEQELKHGNPLEIPLARISPNPWQPRKQFDPEKLDELAGTIQEIGLQQPIVVREKGVDSDGQGQYELIAGERRLRAHASLGMPTIKAILSNATEEEVAFAAMVENMARENLSGYETYKGITKLSKHYPNRSSMARVLGCSRSHLYRYLSYEKLPDFILEDLERQPELLSGTYAEMLSTIISEHSYEAVEPVLKELWQSVKDKSLLQSALPTRLNLRMSKLGRPTPQVNTLSSFYFNDSKIGQVKREGNNLTLKLGLQKISDELKEDIQRDLAKWLKSYLEKNDKSLKVSELVKETTFGGSEAATS